MRVIINRWDGFGAAQERNRLAADEQTAQPVEAEKTAKNQPLP
jgi:hypothetical protein